jgi:hypothetical protein
MAREQQSLPSGALLSEIQSSTPPVRRSLTIPTSSWPVPRGPALLQDISLIEI